MPLKHSEAIVLRTYPLHEADLLVTLFSRLEGKLKGVAKAAKRSRRRFGGALEPLTCVRVYWEDRERKDLARIDSCEVLVSPLSSPVDYARAVALGHVAEMLDQMLPEREPNDTVYRLAVSVIACLQANAIWMPVTYFDLWLVRLMGFLPELGACIVCGCGLEGQRAWFHALADGLMCPAHKRLASSEMTSDSRALVAEMFRLPVEKLVGEPWPRARGADLRKFLMQILARHLERTPVTVAQLEKLD